MSVLIPSYGRPDKLRNLLASLLEQQTDGLRFEVLVGLDGGEEREAQSLVTSLPTARRGDFKISAFPRSGHASVRNGLLESARGRLVLSLNDDVVATPRLIAEHAGAHEQARAEGRRVMVVGAADWRIHPDDTVFDRLVRETSMIFFYDVMDDPARGDTSRIDWGFRHAWGLNTSMHTEDMRRVGAYKVFSAWYGAEDIELAYRVAALPGGRAVWYRRAAHVEHDHRVCPREYVEREYKLGYNAFHFARECAEASSATYGRDVASQEEIVYSGEFVRREASAARRARAHIERAGSAPAREAAGWSVLREALYLAHLPLKRWCWRIGLTDAAGGAPLDPAKALAQSA
ncbi:MAG: glycosyltransferase [Phycisphaerales bacterium]